MNETKHTLGQWRIGDAGLTVFGPPNGNPSPETIAHCRNKTNAQLIAAAPELLAACQNGLRAMRALGWDQSPLESQYFKDYASTASAIYKATGQGIPTPAVSENLNQTWESAYGVSQNLNQTL